MPDGLIVNEECLVVCFNTRVSVVWARRRNLFVFLQRIATQLKETIMRKWNGLLLEIALDMTYHFMLIFPSAIK